MHVSIVVWIIYCANVWWYPILLIVKIVLVLFFIFVKFIKTFEFAFKSILTKRICCILIHKHTDYENIFFINAYICRLIFG